MKPANMRTGRIRGTGRSRGEAGVAVGKMVKKGTAKFFDGYLKGVDAIAKKIEPYASKLPKAPSSGFGRRGSQRAK